MRAFSSVEQYRSGRWLVHTVHEDDDSQPALMPGDVITLNQSVVGVFRILPIHVFSGRFRAYSIIVQVLHMDYPKLLNDSLSFAIQFTDDEYTKFDLMADVFGFTTYDSDMDELMVNKALEVCVCISNGTVGQYIKDEANHQWYVVMVNMPFISGLLDWGTSIRGAWWDHGAQFDLSGQCWAYMDESYLEVIPLDRKQWISFIQAANDFISTVEPIESTDQSTTQDSGR